MTGSRLPLSRSPDSSPQHVSKTAGAGHSRVDSNSGVGHSGGVRPGGDLRPDTEWWRVDYLSGSTCCRVGGLRPRVLALLGRALFMATIVTTISDALRQTGLQSMVLMLQIMFIGLFMNQAGETLS